jgi:hypothetical protein
VKKRVYKFTKAHHGISNLAEKRLKLSTIDDLNDRLTFARSTRRIKGFRRRQKRLPQDSGRRPESYASAEIGTTSCSGVTTVILIEVSASASILTRAFRVRTIKPMSFISRISCKSVAQTM